MECRIKTHQIEETGVPFDGTATAQSSDDHNAATDADEHKGRLIVVKRRQLHEHVQLYLHPDAERQDSDACDLKRSVTMLMHYGYKSR